MNFKQSFQYQKFLDNTIGTLNYYLLNNNNTMKITENHLKSKVNADCQDEVIEINVEKTYNCKVEDVVFLMKQLINEKNKLSTAIEVAKKQTELPWAENGAWLSLDTAVEFNKTIHSIASTLNHLANAKSSDSKKVGTDFTFNINKEQVRFNYTVEVKSEIDFDRNIIKDQYKKLLDKADKISMLIEETMLKDVVRYQPIYDLRDSIEEIIEQYLIEKDKSEG